MDLSSPRAKNSVTAIILAGGQGRRMGGINKALLTLGSGTFLERQIRAFRDSADELIIVANGDRAAEIDHALTAKLAHERSVRIVPDLFVGEGPLAGLHAGLSAATCHEAWVVGCDQPFADAAVMRMLSDEMNGGEACQAVLPIIRGELQPLYAVYKTEVSGAAKELLEGGQRRLLALLDRIAWRSVSEKQFAEQGMPLTFADDVDTPEHYERVRRTYSDSR